MNKENWPFAGAWLSLMLIAGYLQADTGLDVSFRGVLLDNVCTFEQDDAPLEVTFPTRALKYFEQYGRTETQSFSVGLKNCTPATQGKMVALTFTFPQKQVVNGVSMLAPSGETGLVIGLVDGEDNAVVPDQPLTVGAVTHTGAGSVNRFTLGAYVLAPQGTEVKAGRYSATANFTVSYR